MTDAEDHMQEYREATAALKKLAALTSTAETIREIAEDARQKAEQARQAAEAARVTAEDARADIERLRVALYQKLKEAFDETDH